MFQTALIVLSIATILYVCFTIGYVYYQKYREPFKSSTAKKNDDFESAPEVQQTVSQEAERTVTPSGPNPPNAETPGPSKVEMPPETTARDPFEQTESETPIRDNLRHPENFFGPGVDNTGTRVSVGAGIASDQASPATTQFSPEFAQNGGEFLNGVTANDWSESSTYALI